MNNAPRRKPPGAALRGGWARALAADRRMRVGWRAGGQVDQERRTVAGLRLNVDVPIVKFDDVVHRGEAQSGVGARGLG